MQKKFQAICAVFIGLSIYSCSELILPKQVGVKGTLDLPISIGSANLSSVLAKKIKKIFSAEGQEGTKVYNVDYKGQTVQTFCISLPIEMTEDLNPNDFLKTIDKQINDGIHAEPKEINVSIPYVGAPIPIHEIELVDNIPPVSLADIAQYVISIDFDECNGENDLAGIGFNFNFTEIPDGLEMIIECEELKFSPVSKLLKKGDNIFGNKKEQLTLDLAEYKNGGKKINFIMRLQSVCSDNNVLDFSDSYFDYKVVPEAGDILKIKGEMRFFRVWTEAKIDMAAALKVSSKIDDLTGKFPDTVFDLSGLNEYFDGGFTFNGLEVKIYIDGPDISSIDELQPKLLLEAQYNSHTKNLYDDILLINSEPININDYLKNEFYKFQHLPGNASEYDDRIIKAVIEDIFKTMPADLSFIYSIIVENDKPLTIHPNTIYNSGEGSKITTTIMIMLPMSLTAAGSDKSTISLPDMFGNDDLFGREEPEDPFSAADIDYIRMTVDFSDQIFTGGYLFIDKDKDLFPQGIRLNGKKIVLYFTNEKLKIIWKKLIVPDVKIEIDNGGTINVPKNMGIVNIKFEMKGLINIGEL